MSKKKAKVEFIPLIKPCTYHHPDKKQVCRNCKNTMKYKDGYYLVYGKGKKKYAFFVDTIK